MPTITPFLWFDTQAEEAMNLYVSIFKRSKVVSVNRAQGKVMSVQFELEGQPFMALNAGPTYKFTEAISFFVGCETQQEIDELWTKLIADGGAPSRCGWLKDKFGLSWQIIPTSLGRMLTDKDAAKSGRVMNAMLQMEKLDLKRLQQAYDGMNGRRRAGSKSAPFRFFDGDGFPRGRWLLLRRGGLRLRCRASACRPSTASAVGQSRTLPAASR